MNTQTRLARWTAVFMDLFSSRPDLGRAAIWGRRGLLAGVLLLVLFTVLGIYWSREPNVLWINSQAPEGERVAGYATTDTLIRVATHLLDKPGGYLSNDVTPPSIILDNKPNWEQGVLLQIKDLSSVLRNDYSRSQSQSSEDPDLAVADPLFYFSPHRWILPSSENKFRVGIEALESYRARLVDQDDSNAQFYARADNLRQWLALVEKRLGSLTQSLGASVGDYRVNTDLAGDPSAESATPRPGNIQDKTPWLKIDDRFFYARGNVWALVAFLRAAEFDFESVLEDKNARVSLRQIIRELEASLEPIHSPIILNGGGYGMFANHSLVMASYLSRANSGVINLRELLDQG